MPIYEYKCHDCDSDFDLLVMRRDEADSQTCPNCGSKQVRRKLSAFSSPGVSRGGSSCPIRHDGCGST
jgi:putative FmdB family regulatory protein